MTEEVLKEIKKDYEQRKETRNHLSEVLEEIIKLEEDDTVKKYLNLKKELESINYKKIIEQSDEQILYSSFYNNRYMIIETNDIYICMGTFMMDSICDIVHGPSDIRLNRDDPRAEYRIYRNIEDGYSEVISMRKCEEFERMHKVIIPNIYWTEKYFYELQKEFIKITLEEGQEAAYKRVLSKNK